jgi:hypothetical protein
MASPAPPKHNSPRHTVHSPAQSDHSIIPTPNSPPTTMNTQGFMSYSVWGVQERIRGFYSGGRRAVIRLQLRMAFSFRRFAKDSPWGAELVAAAVGLLLGVVLMPVLIFLAGVTALGRFEGASLEHLYSSVFQGLGAGSIASWVVILGPYGLYLLFRALRGWWRAGAGTA